MKNENYQSKPSLREKEIMANQGVGLWKARAWVNQEKKDKKN